MIIKPALLQVWTYDFFILTKGSLEKNEYLGKQGSWVRESPKKKRGKKSVFFCADYSNAQDGA